MRGLPRERNAVGRPIRGPLRGFASIMPVEGLLKPPAKPVVLIAVVALLAFHFSLRRGKGPGFAALGIQRPAGLHGPEHITVTQMFHEDTAYHMEKNAIIKSASSE